MATKAGKKAAKKGGSKPSFKVGTITLITGEVPASGGAEGIVSDEKKFRFTATCLTCGTRGVYSADEQEAWLLTGDSADERGARARVFTEAGWNVKPTICHLCLHLPDSPCMKEESHRGSWEAGLRAAWNSRGLDSHPYSTTTSHFYKHWREGYRRGMQLKRKRRLALAALK